MWEVLFALSLFGVFFAYVGYPLSLLLISLVRTHEVARAPFTPLATLIITACNEEKRIREKLENTLSLDYPEGCLQILVASDGSTDATCAIVREYAERGVELLALPERRGKEFAQKDAVATARGDILVFSDVATRLEPCGVREIVANFADPAVGCVSSVDKVMGQDGRPSGEGAYVRYEMWLRALESKVHSLVGLSGSFFAARRNVCRDFSGEVQSDFSTLLNSLKIGLRGVSDPRAVGFYLDVVDSRREFERKARTVLRGLTVFFGNLGFLNVFHYGLFSYQYFCHKLLRWLVPGFLALALVANAALAPGSAVYAMLLLAQFVLYSMALLGWFRKDLLSRSLFKIPTYFMAVNASILVAWWRFLTGERLVMWTPSER